MEGMEGRIRSSSSFKRCLIERQRRLTMKNLYSHLSSLLPPHQNKMSVPQLIHEATEYIKQKQKRIEHLQQTKVQLQEDSKAAKILPRRIISLVINISDLDSSLEVNLVTRADVNFELLDFVTVLEEEGAKILSVSYHRAGDRFICSIQSQAVYSRIGIATSRVRRRLEGLAS